MLLGNLNPKILILSTIKTSQHCNEHMYLWNGVIQIKGLVTIEDRLSIQ